MMKSRPCCRLRGGDKVGAIGRLHQSRLLSGSFGSGDVGDLIFIDDGFIETASTFSKVGPGRQYNVYEAFI